MATQNDPWAEFRTGGQPAAAPQPSARPLGVVGGQAPSEMRAEESLDIQRRGEERQQRGEQRDIEQRTFERGGKLYDQYVGRTAVKMYEAAWPAFTSAISQPDTTQGNRALIYNAIKILDPEGAVPSGDIEGIESSSPILQRIIRSSGRLLDQGGNLPPEQRKELLDALHQRVTTLRGPYNLVRSDFERRSRNIGIDPLDTIGSPIDQADANVYQEWLRKQQPAAGAGEGGPTVTVTPEESIAEFGELAYDKNGNLVGRAYSQSGAGVYYNSKGEEIGIIRGVAEEKVQEPAPSFFGGIVRDVGEAITGSERATATTEGLPDWVEMPEMQQLFSIPAFKAALGTAFGGGPQEIAQIVQSNFPGTEVFQDEKGNYILRSPSTGQRYAIKPGFQLSDVPRALSILLTGAGGRGAGIAQTALREGALQAGIETTQAATGGTFNPEDIATAAVIGGGGQKLAEVLPGVVQGVRNVRTGRAAPEMAVQGTPELPGGLTRPGDIITPQPAPTAPTAEMGAPIPTGEARVFEAGETVGGRGTAGAMSASEETIRAQRAAELPVPIELARFQRTRNFAEQQRARELAKNNEVGGPIRDRMSQQQDALRQNFERFIEGTGSQVWENPYEQGGVIADALSTLAKRERTKIKALYKRAEQAGEMREPVSYRSLSDFIAGQTPTTREKLAPVLRTVQEQLDAADPNKTGMITLNQMEDIRKLINKVASPGTPDASFGRDMRGIIDDATKDAGGDVYRQARSARAKYARDFDDIDLVQKIYSTKPGSTERYVALEKVVDRITGTSAPLDSVNSLLSLLDRAGPRGARAKRELQGAVMEKIRDQAYRGITRDESGGVVIQPAALNSIIVQLDKSGKLDAIFDKKTAELLRTVNDVTKDIVTAPPGSVNASGTSSAIMNAIDTVATFGTTGIPVPAAKILNEFRKALANRAMRKEVKRLLD